MYFLRSSRRTSVSEVQFSGIYTPRLPKTITHQKESLYLWQKLPPFSPTPAPYHINFDVSHVQESRLWTSNLHCAPGHHITSIIIIFVNIHWPWHFIYIPETFARGNTYRPCIPFAPEAHWGNCRPVGQSQASLSADILGVSTLPITSTRHP